MLSLELKKEIKEYANKHIDEECCGLILQLDNTKYEFFPCLNLSYNKKIYCVLSYLDYIKAEKKGKVIAHFHSQESDLPSLTDNISAYNFNLYSIIYSWKSNNFYIINPELKSYLYKDFKIGENDCFTLIKDYYKEELNINLSEYKREKKWYLENPNLMSDNFNKEGFIKVDKNEMKLHDILLFGKNDKELYHMGIYQDNNLFLHHPRDSKSIIEDLNHLWVNKLVLVIRHKTLL